MGYHWIYSWDMTQIKYNANKPGPIRVWAVEPTSWDHSRLGNVRWNHHSNIHNKWDKIWITTYSLTYLESWSPARGLAAIFGDIHLSIHPSIHPINMYIHMCMYTQYKVYMCIYIYTYIYIQYYTILYSHISSHHVSLSLLQSFLVPFRALLVWPQEQVKQSEMPANAIIFLGAVLVLPGWKMMRNPTHEWWKVVEKWC